MFICIPVLYIELDSFLIQEQGFSFWRSLKMKPEPPQKAGSGSLLRPTKKSSPAPAPQYFFEECKDAFVSKNILS